MKQNVSAATIVEKAVLQVAISKHTSEVTLEKSLTAVTNVGKTSLKSIPLSHT